MEVIAGGNQIVIEPDWSENYSDQPDIESAHQHWVLLERALREAGTLAAENAFLMQRYVHFKMVYDAASTVVAEHGTLIPARRGANRSIARQHPSWETMRQAASDLDRMEAELGLSPRRRGSVTKVDKQERRKAASDAYLSAVTKR